MVEDDPSYVAQNSSDDDQISVIRWRNGSPDTSRNDGHLINDCIYRLRYAAIWATPQTDIDEYLVPVKGARNNSLVTPMDISKPSLPTVLEPYLKKDIYSALNLPPVWYEVAKDPADQIALWSTHRQNTWARQETGEWLCWKAIVRPELVDISFVHWPTNIKQGTETVNVETSLRFNHYRVFNEAELNVTDSDFVQEAQDIQQAVCSALGLGIHCRPSDWLPEGINASEQLLHNPSLR